MSEIKLFVGNLPNCTTKEDVTHLFSKYGEILEVTIVKNFGFIHMSSEDEANHAIEMLDNTDFGGNIINVELSHGGKGKRIREDNVHRPSLSKHYRSSDNRDSRERYTRERYTDRNHVVERPRHREQPHNPLEALTGRPDLPIAASVLAATLLNPNTLSVLQNLANLRNLNTVREDVGRPREERRYTRRTPPRTDRYSSRYQSHERSQALTT